MAALHGFKRYAFASIIGFAGGSSIGLVGWGGAQFIVPGMTHPLMGQTQLAATGISLCSLSLSTVTGAAKFLMSDSVAITTALSIAAPAMVTARLGTLLVARMPEAAQQLVFNGLTLTMMPLHFLVQKHASKSDPGNGIQPVAVEQGAEATTTIVSRATSAVDTAKGSVDILPESVEKPGGAAMWTWTRSHAAILAESVKPSDVAYGCVSGIISAMMGVGGLPLAMSYLTYFTDLPHHHVQGTAVLSVAPAALTSALSRIHVVPPATAAAVAAGAMVGAIAGASLALQLSEENLRSIYMLSLVILGGVAILRAGKNIKTLWTARKAPALKQ